MCIYTVKKQNLKKNKKILRGGAQLHRTAEN